MKILITEPGRYLSESKDSPVVGSRYLLENAETGTGAQNRAAHALIQEYFKSGCYSDEATTWLELKDQLKRKNRLGQGFKAFVYYDSFNMVGGMQDAKKYEDIPEHIRTSDYKKLFIRGKLKSWTEYTMKQRKAFLDGLIAEMDTAGVNTKKYQEIITGMEKSATSAT